ncbi:hypothetical protein RRG08_007917 [Elysia crispata]|uniref:Uncharacterized protein n=1 Tax=Elysia crispata TaxID=231223 RepID=A0AAE1DL59_9GAST|nr:hypothetical protein RRG08_007917 [Elysia crispata]
MWPPITLNPHHATQRQRNRKLWPLLPSQPSSPDVVQGPPCRTGWLARTGPTSAPGANNKSETGAQHKNLNSVPCGPGLTTTAKQELSTKTSARTSLWDSTDSTVPTNYRYRSGLLLRHPS